MDTIGIIQRKHTDNIFFRLIAIASIAAIFAGFARTYFLKSWTGAAAQPALVHIHAILFTTWILLFLVQTTLVANDRIDLHRKLGVFAALLAVAMVVEGYVAAVGSVRRGFIGVFPNEPTGFVDPIAFFSLAMGDILTFSALVTAGFLLRRRAGAHKRLMVLATISLLPAALSRIPLGAARLPVALTCFLCLLLAGPIYDRKTYGRIHPVFLWGTVFTFISTAVRPLIGNSAVWHTFVRWLIRT